MPVWHPNSLRAWAKLDAAVAAPMRKCLQLSRNACLESVLIETNTLSMRMQYELLSIRTAQLALLRPVTHPTRELVDEQANARIAVKSRAPLLPQAKLFAAARQVDFAQPLSSKALLAALFQQQRIEWRNSGKGRLLRQLTNDALGRRGDHLLLPLYLLVDKPRVAAIRARLRFNRSTLKVCLARQNIIKAGGSTDCVCCQYKQKDSLEHMLFSCCAFKAARDVLCAHAKRLGLSVKRAHCRRWMLGDVSRVPSRLRFRSLSLSADFFVSVVRARKL